MNIAALDADLTKIRERALALFKSTATTAEAEGRAFTDAETAALQAVRDEGLALQAKIEKLRGDQSMLTAIEQLTARASADPAAPNRTPQRAQSWGQQFVAGPPMEFFRAGGHRTASAWRSPSMELDWPRGYGGLPIVRGATMTSDPASAGALIVPDYQPGVIQPIPQPILVAELFAQGTTGSNLISYMRELAVVNAAAAVAEGAVKPESSLTFEAATDPVRKIATWLPVTEELLEDAPGIQSYIDARLRQFILTEEQDQLVNGDGTAPNISGILDRAGLAANIPRVDPATNADVLLAQAMAIFASSFLMPDGFVLHPSNWAKTLLTKTSTGDYYTGGPFSPIQTPTLWGLPVAVTPVIAMGTGLVGAFKTGAQIFRKGGVRVEASNSHSDFFIKNLVAIRAEERLALAVYRPGAFGTVTLLT